MIHELIEQKRKSYRTRTSKNTKVSQDHKSFFHGFQEPKEATFEASDNENKEPESASTVFIPPWLRNSLRLNHRNNINQPKVGSDAKSAKTVQRGKGQNIFQSLKSNVEQDSCKKPAANVETLPQENFRDVSPNQETVDDPRPDNNDRRIPIYWRLRRKESDSGSSGSNFEKSSLKKNDSKNTSGEALVSSDAEKNKTENKKKLKFFRAKERTRKRDVSEPKELELSKREVDLLLEFRTKDAAVNSAKGNGTSEVKHREPKFLLLGGKPHNPNNGELNKEKFRLLQEIRNQVEGAEELEGVFEHVKTINFSEATKNWNPFPKNLIEKVGDKEDKGVPCRRKSSQEENSKAEKDSLLSTDDENDIKRFSEFLSKNKNLDEKRKCLEEVRNYFERKRRTRMTKRCILEEEKPKANLKSDWKEDAIKEKSKQKELYRRRRSRLVLDEEAVERAVDETLQKFLEMYHFRMSSTSIAAMKKNILQAIKMDALEGREGRCSRFNELKLSPEASKKINSDLPTRDPEKTGMEVFAERDVSDSPRKESRMYKESKKKHFRTESFGEPFSKFEREGESVSIEDERVKHLKEDFNNFLHSVQSHFDSTGLKLQSVVLEKEDKAALGKSVQLVYSFGTQAVEYGRGELRSPQKIGLELRTRRDVQSQTPQEVEYSKKNVRIQTTELRFCCERGIQTERKEPCARETQTETKGVTVREISELKSHEVSAGLYRMVRSKDAGKFYLYPEESGKQKMEKPSKCYIAKGKKSKRTCFLNITAKEKRVLSKENEKAKLKKIKRALPYKNLNLKSSAKKKRLSGTSEDSINCLYFRKPDKKASESLSSKKDFTDENVKDQFYFEERMGDVREDHLACFWFWNGEKITPGCDLKTHVENIVKEKLTEMTHFEGQQNDHLGNMPPCDASRKNLNEREVNTLFFCKEIKNAAEEISLAFADSRNQEERKETEGKSKESEEIRKPLRSASHEKAVKNVGTQNSQSLPITPLRVTNQSKHKNPVRRKCVRRNIIIKPAPGRGVTLKKAEDIVRAIEEVKKIKLGLDNPNSETPNKTEKPSRDVASPIDSKRNGIEESNPKTPGTQVGPEKKEMPNEFSSNLEKLTNVVDREVQTGEACERENSNSLQSKATDHTEEGNLELIESVLGEVSQKERQRLWNGVREFIKTKIGKDINDEGTREVCIEIEQHVPRIDPGNTKRPVTAKGHYSKNDGDVEMEIDLTLDDLARILRQRQKKIRRRNLCRNNKSKSLLSGASIQSEFTKQDLKRYQKYLQKCAVAEGNFSEDKDSSDLRKSKPSEHH